MSKIKLDELQIAVMQALWKLEEATVAQVQEELKNERDLAITTIGTILSRLEKKGAVSHQVEGKKFIYKPLVTEAETKQTIISSIIQQWFQGKSSSLVNHLLKESEFDNQELDELKKMIDQNTQTKNYDDK
jgi:BlaI family transcriptional regulator, penicillinase repressor